MKAQSLSQEATKGALASIGFILQEINCLESEVQKFSRITSSNNNVGEIMKQLLIRIDNVDAGDDGKIIRKKNERILPILQKIDKLEDYSEDQENNYSNKQEKGNKTKAVYIM